MNNPMSDLLDALAEQCCKLEWLDHFSGRRTDYSISFDSSRAEALISAFVEEHANNEIDRWKLRHEALTRELAAVRYHAECCEDELTPDQIKDAHRISEAHVKHLVEMERNKK